MPVTAATREAIQAHFGAAHLKDDPQAYLAEDFAALIETVALRRAEARTRERAVSDGA